MRTLLLLPEDSPLHGPWSGQRWDLIVDLGKSFSFSEEAWASRCHCRILRSETFRAGIADARSVRQVLSFGRGHLIDEEGIDWWELISLLVAPEVLSLLTLRRVAAEIRSQSEIWATRNGVAVSFLEVLLNTPIRRFGSGAVARFRARSAHYASLVRRFSPAQFTEILFDKYDSSYRWRSRFSVSPVPCTAPVVLLPSAYGNVSRMAAAYAQLLPEQSFLLIATRNSAKQFPRASNIEVRDLASYAGGSLPSAEIHAQLARWAKLKTDLQSDPYLRLLEQAGVLSRFPASIRDGLCARNAWREAIAREPVCGILCGDDSNLFTRLPVLLAARRDIPTVDFHHGALDGRYLLKELRSDLYLAKNEMERDYLLRVCGLPSERVAIGSPAAPTELHQLGKTNSLKVGKTSAIFFSEPYEVAGMRAEEVYQEILPRLFRISREHGLDLIVKLHPFESRSQRKKIVRDVLGSLNGRDVAVIDGPLSAELLAEARFGVTVESTTVIDCLIHGLCCFLCGWLSLSPYEYTRQYARFGVGEVLASASELETIPRRCAEFEARPAERTRLSPKVDPEMLRQWLTTRAAGALRSAS
jgi:hypothetical protein